MLKALEVYDPNFATVYSNVIHGICGISICLTSLLMYVMTTKTPPFMSNLKVYLIPYCINIIVIKLVFLLYTPICLHPFIYFYPTGIAKYFPLKLSLLIIVIGIFSALSLIDCFIGIAMERAHALKCVETLSTGQWKICILHKTIAVKPPLLIFIMLIFSGIICLFAGISVILFDGIFYQFFATPDEIPNIVDSQIIGLGDLLDLKMLNVYRNSDNSNLTIFIIFIASLSLSHLVIALQLMIYNGVKSQSLRFFMSPETGRRNSMLLKMTYFQFFGFSVFLGFPVVIVILTYIFCKKPIMSINYCFAVMNCFSIFDTVITIYCIKPYRMFVSSVFKRFPWNSKQVTVVIPSLQF